MSSQIGKYQNLIFDHLTLHSDEYFTFEKLRDDLDEKIGILTRSKRKDFFEAFNTLDDEFENVDKDYIFDDGLQTAIAFVTNKPENKKKVSLSYLPRVNLSEVPNYLNKVLEEDNNLFDPFYPTYDKKKSVFDYLVESAKIKNNINEDQIPEVFDRMIKDNYHYVSRNAEKNLKNLLKIREQLSEIETDVSLELEDKVDKLVKKLSSEYIDNLLFQNKKLQEEMNSREFSYNFAFWASNLAWLALFVAYVLGNTSI